LETDEGFALESTERLDLTSTSRSYTRNLAPKSLFDDLYRVGVVHGPLFQNIKEIRAGNDSVTTMTVSDVAAVMPYNYQQPHVIHPITLDSVFHAIYTALPPEARKAVGGSVPRSIKEMRVSSRISNCPGNTMRAYSHLLHHNLQGFDAVSAVVQDGSETPVLEISDMHFQSLGRTSDESEYTRAQLCLV